MHYAARSRIALSIRTMLNLKRYGRRGAIARRLGGASASREGRPRLIPTLSMCYPGIAPPPAPPPPRAPAPRAAVCPVRFTTDYAIRATAMRARADTRTRDDRCTHGYTHTGVPDNNITDHS